MVSAELNGSDLWQWPLDRPRDEPRQSWTARLRGWIVVIALGVLLVQPATRMGPDASGPRMALLIADLAAYLVSFVLVSRIGPRSSRPARVLMIVWLLLLGLALPFLTGEGDSLVYLAFAIVAAVMLLPVQVSRLVGLGSALAQVVLTRVLDGEVHWTGTTLLVLLTLSVSLIFLLTRAVAQLKAAREALVHQVVADERARVARDLHDVLGHSVAVITVKSGLARRMLETGAEPAAVAAEVRDIEELSRTALGDIRSTVLDTRSSSLDDELASARMALRAAGIAETLPDSGDEVRADLRDVFGYVLREGVTNVIKHSGARSCTVRIGPNWLEIQDDGRGGRFAVAGSGYGLLSLGERLRAVGATLESSRARGGFRLRAEAPAEPVIPRAAAGH
ncbi:histidine kinase [Kitasatospora sp. NPDC050463]|uniref:sensor histidine kinase n=1 Tax=Kitasatospora sp. NPDC050463 TaxID=3155786 RepID=UPI003404D3E0